MNPAELLEIVLPAWQRQLPERFAPDLVRQLVKMRCSEIAPVR